MDDIIQEDFNDNDKEDKIYLDEELDEIEYYEILSFDEIVNENPNFIAFSKKELYIELYDLFNNANKTNTYIDLFYNKIDNDNIFDTTNYTLVTDSFKKTFHENDDPKDGDNDVEPGFDLFTFIDQFRKINKYKDNNIAIKEKNKLFFTIEYDDNSSYVRFKPLHNTLIKINNNDNDHYMLLNTDNTYIPVKNITYNFPKYIDNDYLSDKVLSHLKKNINIKTIVTNNSQNINDNLNNCKLSINDIIDNLDINELKNLEHLDYESLSILLEKFDYKLDNITYNDLNILNNYIKDIYDNVKYENYTLKSFRIKLLKIINHKTLFYNFNNNIFKLLYMSEQNKEDNDIIISNLEDKKNSIHLTDILYNNINDIVNAINDDVVDEKIIFENIKNIKNYQILDNIINTIKNFNNNNLDDIQQLYDLEKKKYESMINFSYNLYNVPLKFSFKNELNDIIVANDYTDYNFNNSIDINNDFVDLDNKFDIDFDENLDINFQIFNKNFFDEFIEKSQFLNEHGFKECLRIILPMIQKIQEKSKLDIDYHILCNNLFKNFSNLPLKKYILTKYIETYGDKFNFNDKILDGLSNIDYKLIINNKNNLDNIKLQISFITNIDIDTLINIIIAVNKEFLNNIKNMFLNAISLWILEIQNNIINLTHLHNYNLNYIHLWSDFGFPINKNKKNGITYYLSDIIVDQFKDDNLDRLFNIDYKIVDQITYIIDNDYKKEIDNLRNIIKDQNIDYINRNKGKKYQLDLVSNLNDFKQKKTLELKDKMLYNYINALIYMPGINYNRIHKYLLGCCLQQINNDFNSDNDLKGKRNDLIAAKTYFSKFRENNKNRDYTFLPFNFSKKNIIHHDDNDHDYDDVDDDKKIIFKNLNHDIDNHVNDSYNYDQWLINLSNYTDNNIITKENFNNVYSNGSSQFLKIIKSNLYYLTKTINNSKSSIIDLFIDNINTINFKQIILNTITTLNRELYKLDQPDLIISEHISYIKKLLFEFDNLNNIISNNDITNIIRAKAYITSKIICSPFNTDNILGEKLQLFHTTDNSKFYIDILKIIHNSTIKIIQSQKVPTLQENAEFLSKMREEFKSKKLEIFDKQTEEQRKVFNELSKIGVRIENMDIDDDNDTDLNKENPPFDGENDFIMNGNENDYDDDYLDNDDVGHVYE